MSRVGETLRGTSIVQFLGEGNKVGCLGIGDRLRREVALEDARVDRSMDEAARRRPLRDVRTLSQLEHRDLGRVCDQMELSVIILEGGLGFGSPLATLTFPGWFG